MTFTYPVIGKVETVEGEGVVCVVIENKRFYSELICDLCAQIEGSRGKAVISDGIKILDPAKAVDLSASFFPFEINRKNLISKIVSAMEKQAQTAEYFEKTAELLCGFERYMDDLSLDFSCDLIYNKLNVSSLIKAAGIEIADDSTTLSEKMLNYMELVREFEGNKLFITVNMRSFVEDPEAAAFLESAVLHKFDLLMFEGVSYNVLPHEKRLTVDTDLCCF